MSCTGITGRTQVVHCVTFRDRRQRRCLNPPPSRGGRLCSGKEQMAANCTGGLCPLVAHSPTLPLHPHGHNVNNYIGGGGGSQHDNMGTSNNNNNNHYYADQHPTLAHDQGSFLQRSSNGLPSPLFFILVPNSLVWTEFHIFIGNSQIKIVSLLLLTHIYFLTLVEQRSFKRVSDKM